MNRQEMIERLKEIKKSQTIERNGKTYKVLGAKFVEDSNRVDMRILEVGRERYTPKSGKFLAEGKTFKFDNSTFLTLRPQKSHMNYRTV